MFIQKIADITGNADRTKEGKEQRVGNGQGRVASGKEGSSGGGERGRWAKGRKEEDGLVYVVLFLSPLCRLV